MVPELKVCEACGMTGMKAEPHARPLPDNQCQAYVQPEYLSLSWQDFFNVWQQSVFLVFVFCEGVTFRKYSCFDVVVKNSRMSDPDVFVRSVFELLWL